MGNILSAGSPPPPPSAPPPVLPDPPGCGGPSRPTEPGGDPLPNPGAFEEGHRGCKDLPKAVRVLQSPGGPVVAGRGPLRLRCQIGDDEPPEFTVSCYKNGRELPGPAPNLLLPGPEPADAVTYVCQARNDVGVTRSPPLDLDVRFGPQEDELVPDQEVELVEDPSQRVQEKTDVTQGCRAKARPPHSVSEWFWDGRPLGQAPEGFWLLQGAEAEASRQYWCRITNDIATANSSDVIVAVYYSTAAIQKTTSGLSLELSISLVLGTLLVLGIIGYFLRRRRRQRRQPTRNP